MIDWLEINLQVNKIYRWMIGLRALVIEIVVWPSCVVTYIENEFKTIIQDALSFKNNL